MEKIALVILAAGLGKRMKSELPKVAIRTRDKSLIQHVLESAAPLQAERRIVVVGHRHEVVEESVQDGAAQGWYTTSNLHFALQAQPLGTGDAVKAALPGLKGFSGTVLILCGDAPLLRTSTLLKLAETHQATKSTITILSFLEPRPNAYGRIVRESGTNQVRKIVEAKDATPQELAITECNSSIYAVDSAFLEPALKLLKNNNQQKEYYFTDIVAQAVVEGQSVTAMTVPDATETFGVNTPLDLALINEAINVRKVEDLILSGVTVEDAGSLYIESSVSVAPGAHLGPQLKLLGNTSIAAGAHIEGCSLLKDTQVAEGALVKFGVRAERARIGPRAAVGPFAHLREGTDLGEESRIGNFVETKKATLGAHAKASHLTYLGDCHVGEEANIGAGTITCNYDGYNKNTTTIGKGAFIGSNSCLVAPVSIGDGAFVGAGSVVSKAHVPADSLALSRAPLKIKEGWSSAYRDMQDKKK